MTATSTRAPGSVKFRAGGYSPRPATAHSQERATAVDSVKFRNRRLQSGWEAARGNRSQPHPGNRSRTAHLTRAPRAEHAPAGRHNATVPTASASRIPTLGATTAGGPHDRDRTAHRRTTRARRRSAHRLGALRATRWHQRNLPARSLHPRATRLARMHARPDAAPHRRHPHRSALRHRHRRWATSSGAYAGSATRSPPTLPHPKPSLPSRSPRCWRCGSATASPLSRSCARSSRSSQCS